MPRKVRFLRQLLKIVWQANHIEFQKAVVHVQTRRVHISVDDAERVQM